MKNRKNIVGPIVRRLRNNQNISQEALAAKCQVTGWDISREGIAKIEAQIRGVSDIEILKLNDPIAPLTIGSGGEIGQIDHGVGRAGKALLSMVVSSMVATTRYAKPPPSRA